MRRFPVVARLGLAMSQRVGVAVAVLMLAVLGMQEKLHPNTRNCFMRPHAILPGEIGHGKRRAVRPTWQRPTHRTYGSTLAQECRKIFSLWILVWKMRHCLFGIARAHRLSPNQGDHYAQTLLARTAGARAGGKCVLYSQTALGQRHARAARPGREQWPGRAEFAHSQRGAVQ